MVSLVAERLRAAIVDEVGLEPDDRLDAVSLAGLVVLHGAVHHAVVRQPQRGLLECGGALGQRLDPAGAVEERVLRVHVEVDTAHARGECTVGRRRLGRRSRS